ncbi:MAG: glycoside hydrolase family 127 protein [Streptosporangiaceae bacterium]
MSSQPVSRRAVLAAIGGGAAGAVLGSVLPPGRLSAASGNWTSGYVPDGTTGLSAAFPLSAVRLLDSPLRANQARNTNYLMFVDPDRMLHTFRHNYGLPSSARPCGGWEAPGSLVRGHCTGHLMSGLALTYANTGNQAAADKGAYLVDQLAGLQARDRAAGFHDGYLSAFPERFFGRLEAGLPVWSPYYMIHKLMAGLIDQHELAGNTRALEMAARLGDWVGWRTGRLSYAHMQRILEIEHGGIAESLTNLYRLTWDESYLRTAERFYHARVFDPLARGQDDLHGLHANTNIPKMIACIRIWEETGDLRYHDIGTNFWRIVTDHHAYVIGGTSNYEHWHAPDVIAGQLSNRTCENCCSYNMLKLTRLLHFHQPHRVDLLDYYERTLFNQMLGEQDPRSAHGFNIYYTGLSPAAFKRQPPFMGTNPDVYSTNYHNFSCDDATGMETQSKFADTIYSRDAGGLFVNLFIPSEVRWAAAGMTIRQETGFPDEPATHLTVVSGSARMAVRVRLPGWLAGPARAWVNGEPLAGPLAPGTWLVIERLWRPGDRVDVSLPMALALNRTPDRPGVQAVTYGPVVLSGGYGGAGSMPMPRLTSESVTRIPGRRLRFAATAGGHRVELIPIARMHHQHYNVYWLT